MSRRAGKTIAHIAVGVAALSLSFAPAGSHPAPEGYPPETILLFVASWCAPCRVELAQLPEIRRAARPYGVRVVGYDDLPATRRMLEGVPPAALWVPDRAARRRLAQAMPGLSAGLPFSIAVDAAGRPCGSARQGLDAASAAALVAGCRRGGAGAVTPT